MRRLLVLTLPSLRRLLWQTTDLFQHPPCSPDSVFPMHYCSQNWNSVYTTDNIDMVMASP